MDDLLKSVASEFLNKDSEAVNIIEFCEAQWGLNLKLTPVQKFTLKCYYGIPLSEDVYIDVPNMVNDKILHTFNEKEFLQWLYQEGRCNTNVVEGKNFRELILPVGRRSGKSLMSSAIASYENYRLIKLENALKHYGIAEGAMITVMNVAPTEEQAGAVFRQILGNAKTSPMLKDRIINDTTKRMTLATDVDFARFKGKGKIRASIQCLSGGCAANSLRGHAAIVVILDEYAFFLDNGGKMSAEEIYKALTPSTAQFPDGRIVIISSPYAKFGYFYERWYQSFEETETTLMFNFYTALVNPTRVESSFLKASLKRDKTGFMAEFGAEFQDNISAWIEDQKEFFGHLIDEKLYQKERGVKGVRYYVGIDIAHKNDGCAIAIVHKEENTIVLDYHDVWFSGSSDVWQKEESIYSKYDAMKHVNVLRMEDFVKEISEINKKFPIKKGIFDQSEGFGFQELLIKYNLGDKIEMKHFNDNLNHQIYDVLKTKTNDGLVKMYSDDSIISEMRQLEGEKRGKANIHVRAPQRKGCHDDISDAIARAVWLCNENEKTTVKSNSNNVRIKSRIDRVNALKKAKLAKNKRLGISRY